MSVTEVDIFDAEANTFHQPQAGSVQQLGHQPVIAFEVREHRTGFARREDHGQLRWPRNALDVLDEVEFSLEHPLVKKQQRAERLILSGRSNIFFNGQVRQKLRDLAFAHFTRMTFVMKKNEAANPIDICLLRTDRIMFHT